MDEVETPDAQGVDDAVDGPAAVDRVTLAKSPHLDEYVSLMEAGWSSIGLERYASYRYGETIPASHFRVYKHRHSINPKSSVLMIGAAPQTVTAQVDVMKVREEMVALQMHRIAIDVKHETDMSKLFNTVGREIDLLDKLLDKLKADQMDFGILPRGEQPTVNVNVGTEPTKRATLREVLGLRTDLEVMEAAEALATVIQFPDQLEA